MATNIRLSDIGGSSNRQAIEEPSFFRPRLSIEYNADKQPSIFSPDRTYTIAGVSRRYLRISVNNAVFMSKVANHCKARLIVRPINRQIQYPTIENVPLTWEGSFDDVNVKTITERNIQPGEKALLHVVFSDSTFATIGVEPPTPIHAVISTKAALDTFPPRIIEIGFIIGDFIIEVVITSDNGRPCKSYFVVHVEEQWNGLKMTKLSWFKGLAAKLRSWMRSR